MFEDKGVKFISKAEVLQFEGEAGRVKSAVLTDGTKLPAQICVIGAGYRCIRTHARTHTTHTRTYTYTHAHIYNV